METEQSNVHEESGNRKCCTSAPRRYPVRNSLPWHMGRNCNDGEKQIGKRKKICLMSRKGQVKLAARGLMEGEPTQPVSPR